MEQEPTARFLLHLSFLECRVRHCPDDLVHTALVAQGLGVLPTDTGDGCAGDDGGVASICVKGVEGANLLRILGEVLHLPDTTFLHVGSEISQLVELNTVAPAAASGRVVVGDEELGDSLVETVNPSQVCGLLFGGVCVLAHDCLLSSSNGTLAFTD